MSAPRINPALLSATARANLEKVQLQIGGGGALVKDEVAPTVAKPRAKKKTLTPDMADSLVKSVWVSEDGNTVKILLAVEPGSIPTAQQKGAFVGKDGKVHFFTKSKIAKAGKALSKSLSPYAHLTARWGRVPIQFTFDAYFAYPTSTPKKDRHKIGPHTERPDGDNLLKLPADIMTEAGFWQDDSLIGTYIIRKRRTTGPACIKMTIENLQPRFDTLYRDTEEHDAPTLFTQSDTKPSETNPLSDLMAKQSESNNLTEQETKKDGMF